MTELFNCIDVSLGGNSKTMKRLAQFKNQVEFMNALARLTKRALARYSFEGLPVTVNERVLKMALLFHGCVCFFEKEGNILALPALPNSNLNLYGEWKSCYVYGRNGFNAQIPLYIPGADESKTVNAGDININITGKASGVFVRENEFIYPFINYCITYAEKIADCMRTIDVTRKNIKKPFIITAEEQLVPTIKKFFDNRDNNEEYIVSSGVFPADRISLLPIETNADSIKAATDLIEWYYNDFDNLCNWNSNANPDKKERLLVDEVNSNNESMTEVRDNFIEYLQEQIDNVNKYLGTNIKVKIKEDEANDDIRGMGTESTNGKLAAGPSNR